MTLRRPGLQPVPLHARLRAAGGGARRLRLSRLGWRRAVDRRRRRRSRVGRGGRVHRRVLLARRTRRTAIVDGVHRPERTPSARALAPGADGVATFLIAFDDPVADPPLAGRDASTARAGLAPLAARASWTRRCSAALGRAPRRRRQHRLAAVVAAEPALRDFRGVCACRLPRPPRRARRRPGRDRLPRLDGSDPHGPRALPAADLTERAGGRARRRSPPRSARSARSASTATGRRSRRLPLDGSSRRRQADSRARRRSSRASSRPSAGLLSSAPPPGPRTPAVRAGPPPPWAQ